MVSSQLGGDIATRHWRTVLSGALAAVLTIIIPFATMCVFGLVVSPFQTVMFLPLFLICISPWVVVAAIIGALIGKLVTYIEWALIASLLGAAVVLLVLGACDLANRKLFDSLPGFHHLCWPMGALGAITGVAASAAKRSFPKSPRLDRSSVIALIVPALILMALLVEDIRFSHNSRVIEDAGGSVTYSQLEDPHGRWEINFRGKPFNDADLQAIIPTLHSFKQIELDLGFTGVTDAGVARLTELSNVARLRVDHTAVSATQVNQLRVDMPNTEILQAWP